jgi:hypothetical protein
VPVGQRVALRKLKLNGTIMKIKNLFIVGLVVLASCGDQVIVVQTKPATVEKPAASPVKKTTKPAIMSIQKVVPKVQECPSFGANLVNVEETKDDKICYYLAETE